MPFYRAVVRPDLLDESRREAFSRDVVDVHCGVTGAPPSFVHVLVSEDRTGQLGDGRNASIVGTIRSGRNEAQKAEITSRLSAALAERAGVAADTVDAALRDIDASYTMEGGVLLPEPGSPEEEAWKALGSAS